MSSSSFSAASAFPIVNLAIGLVAVGSSVVCGVGNSLGIGARAGTGTSAGAGIGLKKGVGVMGLANVSLSMTALIGAPGPSLFLAAFEPFLGLRTASETSTPFASYVACIFHNVDMATKKLSRHRLPLACYHLQP